MQMLQPGCVADDRVEAPALSADAANLVSAAFTDFDLTLAATVQSHGLGKRGLARLILLKRTSVFDQEPSRARDPSQQALGGGLYQLLRHDDTSFGRDAKNTLASNAALISCP